MSNAYVTISSVADMNTENCQVIHLTMLRVEQTELFEEP